MKKIMIINGVNLNMLGVREPEIYGNKTLIDLEKEIRDYFLGKDIEIEFYQSNIEGEIVNKIHSCNGCFDGIVINPGAFTHYSYAICDAISSIDVPTIEVHISNTHTREEFRHKSVTAKSCIGQIMGFGFFGYIMAILALTKE